MRTISQYVHWDNSYLSGRNVLNRPSVVKLNIDLSAFSVMPRPNRLAGPYEQSASATNAVRIHCWPLHSLRGKDLAKCYKHFRTFTVNQSVNYVTDVIYITPEQWTLHWILYKKSYTRWVRSINELSDLSSSHALSFRGKVVFVGLQQLKNWAVRECTNHRTH